MRRYEDKANVQKRAYHSDRFRIAPQIEHFEVQSDESFAKTLLHVEKNLHVENSYIELEQLVLWVKPEDNIKALELMKEDAYEILCELSAIDFIESKGGFEIFYQLLSMSKRKRARIKCFLPNSQSIKSAVSVYKSANWSEREMYDMFGIIIEGHPCLKRLLMPDDWHGHPLLKTYPLQGDEAAQWYEVDKIFGEEYREVIGPEQRDTARVNEEDTKNFARINHEVPYGTPYSKEKTVQEYQEDGGINIVKKVKKSDGKTIKGRR